MASGAGRRGVRGTAPPASGVADPQQTAARARRPMRYAVGYNGNRAVSSSTRPFTFAMAAASSALAST